MEIQKRESGGLTILGSGDATKLGSKEVPTRNQSRGTEGAVQIERGADEREVREGLREVPQRFTVPAGFFSVQVPMATADRITDEQVPKLIVDGVIGYNLRGTPAGAAAMLIEWANAERAPVLALDAPSGVDTTTGTVYEPTVRADATMTLALPKEGLRAPGVAPYVGELYLADISVPPSLYAAPAIGLSVGPLFARDDVIRLA